MNAQRNHIGPTGNLSALAGNPLIGLSLVLMLVSSAFAGDLSFAWSPVSYNEAPLVYEVHYGEVSRGYNGHVAATDTTATVSELQGDHTYYFAVRACTDSRDLCSGFSNELSSTIPGAPVVNFTASTVSGAAPLKVNFTASVSGSISKLNWWFEAGDTATGNNAKDLGGPSNTRTSFTYTTPGTYDVLAVATGPGGKTRVYKSGYITVTAPSAASNNTVTGQGGTGNANTSSHAPAHNDVVIDYGDGHGIWLYRNSSTWFKLDNLSAEEIVSADLDGNGIDEIVVDFGSGIGVFIWFNDTEWRQLHAIPTEFIKAVDFRGNGQHDLIVDFGPKHGLWLFSDMRYWKRLHTRSPEFVIAGDLDGNGVSDVAVDYGNGHGLWFWMNKSSWWKLHSVSPDSLIMEDVDVDGKDDLIINFGRHHGVWAHFTTTGWQKLHDKSAEDMSVATAGSGDPAIFLDFGPGNGIWVFSNMSDWTRLHHRSPNSLHPIEIEGRNDTDLLIDYGEGHGLWMWKRGSWEKLHSASVESVSAADLDDNGTVDIVADFGDSLGLWVYMNDLSWHQMHTRSPKSTQIGATDAY